MINHLQVSQFNGFDIVGIPAFDDNYIWCMYDHEFAYVVDPGDASPVLEFLRQKPRKLAGILITHHHYDHTNGIKQLLANYPNIPVYGPNNPTIDGITMVCTDGDHITLDKLPITFSIMHTPGHTLDHICFVNPQLLFCGDTLFSAGCGRMFEGSAAQFFNSLQKLAALPGGTAVFCTHEYTLANMTFAQHVEPNNHVLHEHFKACQTLRASMRPTLPSEISLENQINPFLHCQTVEEFAQLRAQKDNF